MSTKKTAEKATVCAGCEKRDATIKRQAEENTGLRGTADYWNVEWCKAMQLVRNLEGERNDRQARIDSFIKTCADIRAACVAAGIEHADKMATLTAVKALAENANTYRYTYDGALNLSKHVTETPTLLSVYKVVKSNKEVDVHIDAIKDCDCPSDVPAPTTAERQSVMPLVILALNLAILGRLLTM